MEEGLLETCRQENVAHAEQWEQFLEQQDELFAAVLQEKLLLENSVVAEREEAARERREEVAEEPELEDEKLCELELEIERAREAYVDTNNKKEKAENVFSHLESRMAETHERIKDASNPRPSSLPNSAPVDGPRTTLVFINGTTAPFADELIRLGSEGGRRASKALREYLVPPSSKPEDVVLLQLWYDRKQVLQSLRQSSIISAPSTWNNFIRGFCREPITASTNTMNSCFELRSDLIDAHVAATLSRLGHMKSIERIVFVGMHPNAGVFDSLLRLEDADQNLPNSYTQGILPRVEIYARLSSHFMIPPDS
ncbi:hypothetical protein JCM10908_001206 [Rhodotorula pacifica]|uniref:uncharacterized protein n=1 Tax=Rhodotorula pacifica TaxID=1495444 RepID=UPI003176F154